MGVAGARDLDGASSMQKLAQKPSMTNNSHRPRSLRKGGTWPETPAMGVAGARDLDGASSMQKLAQKPSMTNNPHRPTSLRKGGKWAETPIMGVAGARDLDCASSLTSRSRWKNYSMKHLSCAIAIEHVWDLELN